MAHIGERQLLLVLDNCEHVVRACARLAEGLLTTCPNLRVLATSREPLHIAGEVAWRVPSPSAPEAERLRLPVAVLSCARPTALTRQQTLTATLDWSRELLDDDERTVLRRLGTFAGSCDLDAVETV